MFLELMDEESWECSNSWGGNIRKSSGLRESSIPSLTAKNRFSPPSVAHMRNLMYGNGKGNTLSGWDEEEERYIVHMRGLPYRATEQDIMDVSSIV